MIFNAVTLSLLISLSFIFFCFIISRRRANQIPCVIYLHGNSSCRLEAIQAIPHLLPMGISVFAFDFSGSGLSGGQFVSLGFYERQDVETVVEFLRSNGRTSYIGLWGRSMGAATSLMYGEADPSIACMVLDSPFASLRMLAEELVESFTALRLSRFLVGAALMFVRRTILSRANFDIDDLCPIKHAAACFIPAFFVHADGDSFIHPHHSKQISKIYPGDHEVKNVDGDHNSARPGWCMTAISIFFHNHFRMDELPSIPVITTPVVDPIQLVASALVHSGQAVSPNRNPVSTNSRRTRHTNSTLRAQALAGGVELDAALNPSDDMQTFISRHQFRQASPQDPSDSAHTLTSARESKQRAATVSSKPLRHIENSAMPEQTVVFKNGQLLSVGTPDQIGGFQDEPSDGMIASDLAMFREAGEAAKN